MTRKDELKQRAMTIGQLNDTQKGYLLAFEIFEALQQVEREVLGRVKAQMSTTQQNVLSQWGHDSLVPHTEHMPKDCNDRCDGYCIIINEFSSMLDWLTAQQKELG